LSWRLVPFEKLYLGPSRNGVYKSSEFHGRGTKIVNMGEMFGYDFIGNQEMKRIEMTDAEIDKSGLIDGDLLFGRRSLVESGAGKCSIVVDPTDSLTFESSIIRVRLNHEIANPMFYYYWFKSPIGRGGILAIVTGLNIKGIKGSNLKNVKVAHPDRDVQDSIVDICKNYDNLIENNRRRIQLLEESARMLYKEWFIHLRFPGYEHVEISGGVPEKWKRLLFGEFIDVRKGKNITHATAEDGVIPVVAGGLKPAYFHSIANVKGPVITISASGANAGHVNLYHQNIWASDCSYINYEVDKNIYFRYLQLKNAQKEIFAMQHGAAQPHVYPKDIARLVVVQPADNILELFNELVAEQFMLIKKLNAINKQLESARNILIPQLMNEALTV
jgi:type I restriction enzyme, S subunit